MAFMMRVLATTHIAGDTLSSLDFELIFKVTPPPNTTSSSASSAGDKKSTIFRGGSPWVPLLLPGADAQTLQPLGDVVHAAPSAVLGRRR